MMRIAATILLLFGLIGAPARAQAASAGHKAAQTRMGNSSDAEIQQTLEKKLAKSKVGKDGFRFHVSRGVVTWEGYTNVMQHKGAATRMARSAGAVQVINNIRISAAAKANGTKGLRRASVVPLK
jgi:osmotically-inducible protein OsmY